MGTSTKPVRIYESDHAPLRLLAATEGRSQADVVHAALHEYMQRHRTRLAQTFEQAQAAVAQGDLTGLTAVLEDGALQLARGHAQRLRALRS